MNIIGIFQMTTRVHIAHLQGALISAIYIPSQKDNKYCDKTDARIFFIILLRLNK